MRQYVLVVAAVAIISSFNIVESRSIVKRQIQLDTSLDPVANAEELSDEDRDKREAYQSQDPKFAVKNALLGFVFHPSSLSSSGSKGVTKSLTTSTKRPTTTEDIVIFEKNRPVSLDVPDRLFGSSFTLLSNVSNTVGDYMINSAVRLQRVLETMRPFFRAVFGTKGFVIEATDDSKPIFSDGSATTTTS